MRRTFITLLVMAAALAPRSASGLNSTPGSDRAISLGLADYEIGNQGAMMQYVASALDYRLDVVQNLILTDNPTFTIPLLGNALSRGGYGWWFISGHSSGSALQVEPFLTSAARDATIAAYLSDGYGIDELVLADHGPAFGVGVTTQFLWLRYADQASLVHIVACNSQGLYNGFPGRQTFLGYTFACMSDTATNDTRDLYSRMAGWQGVAKRTVGQAYLGTSLAPPLGNSNLVLAPIVSNTNLVPGETIDRPTPKFVEFDTGMNASVPAVSLLSGTGELDVSNASWSGTNRVNFTVTGYSLGSGSICVVTDTSSSIIFGGATSYPGYIHLAGNQSGGNPPQNGWAPCGNYVVNGTSSMGGDNPKADVPGFFVVTAGAGVAVEMVVEAEYQTDHYLIEHAADRAGSFVTLADIQASGPRVHHLTIPGAPMDGVYRLMEVETTGRQLQHGLTEVTAPRMPMNDEVPEVSPETESILEFYRQQYLAIDQARITSPQSTENFEYNIFTRNAFLSRAQSYMGFLATKGIHVGNIYTMESNGGPAMIKPTIEGLRSQGGRYFLRYGDSNDDSDVDGVHWWSDNTRWINGFVRGNFPSQAAYNFVPGKYFAVTDSQQVSMTGTTPYAPWDGWFTDFDGDSLGDPGLAFGNAPIRSDAEAANWNLKQWSAWNMSAATSYMNHVGAFVQAQPYIGNSGDSALVNAQRALQHLPGNMVVDWVVDGNLANPMLPSERNTALTNAYTQGRSVLYFSGTISSGRGTHIASFWDKYYGFVPSSLPSNPTRLPFVVAPTCGSMNTCETENPATGFGRPLMDIFSILPDKGPWGGFGWTRGSWQKGNGEAGDEIMKRLFQTGSRSAAMACFEGVYLAAQQDPYHKELFMSGRFIGCPAVRLVNMATSTVDVGDQPTPSTLQLERPFPNPAVGRSTFRFSLPVPTQVNLSIYDVQGRLVRTLVNAPYPAGRFTVSWDGHSDDSHPAATGIHFVRLEAAGQHVMQKVMYVH